MLARRGTRALLPLLALVGIPALIATNSGAKSGDSLGATTTPTAPATKTPTSAPPAKAALTVQLEGAEREAADDRDDSGRILIQAKGLPPQASSLLASGDGLKATEALAEPVKSCSGLPIHHASQSPGGQKWCISLSKITDGSAVSGLLNGPQTELTLTVNRRVGFWSWPFWITLAGIVLGGLAILVPKFLRKSTRSALLATLLEKNASAPLAQQVSGLDDWVSELRTNEKSDDEILPLVAGLLQRAPEITAKARETLRAAIATSTLAITHPAMEKAQAALDGEGQAVKDLIKEDGTPTVHPMAQIAATLVELESQSLRLADLEAAIETLPSGGREKSQAALRSARATFNTVARDDQMSTLRSKVDDLATAVAEASGAGEPLPRPNRMIFMSGMTVNDFATSPQATGRAQVAQRPAGIKRLVERYAMLILLTGLILAVTTAWAVTTIKLTIYDPKPAFGSGTDCLALLVAAVGSGAAAAILSTLSMWDTRSPAQD